MLIINRFALENPFITGLILLFIALAFRLIDIFILRLDERWGEIFLSKALGFGLILAFLAVTGWGLKSIGLHSQGIGKGLLVGAGSTFFALICGYGAEFLYQYYRGTSPSFYLGAIDPKAGVAGGILFGFWLLLGNVVNSLMEEGLFRGVMLRLFSTRLALVQANWLQAFLFGGWHLPWVLKGIKIGQLKSQGEVAFSLVANFLPQLCLGLVWGYLYYQTNSLWAPIISHFLTNTVLNFVHIQTDEGLDAGIAVRMIVYTLVMLLGMLIINKMNRWFEISGPKQGS